MTPAFLRAPPSTLKIPNFPRLPSLFHSTIDEGKKYNLRIAARGRKFSSRNFPHYWIVNRDEAMAWDQ